MYNECVSNDYFRFKAVSNSLNNTGFKIAWTAVQLPYIIENEEGELIGEMTKYGVTEDGQDGP